MRVLRLSVLGALVCLSIGYGQSTSTPTIYDPSMLKPGGGPPKKLSPEEQRLLTIEHLMQSPSPLQVGNAQLHRLGDQAAVDIIRILSASDVSESQTLTILDMLRKAFERPAAILVASDRQPRATLFLLQALGASSQTQSLKQQIAETKQIVLSSVPLK